MRKVRETRRGERWGMCENAGQVRWLLLAVGTLCLLCVILWLWGSSIHGSEQDVAVAPTSVETVSSLPNDVIFSCPNDRMEIALTFDDGPHPRYTPEILQILAEYDIRATFFMIGENVRYYRDTAAAVIEAGHEVGNHTYSHRSMRRLDDGGVRREIESCEDAIGSIAEYRPRFLRPPEGDMNEHMKNVIGDMDYRIILWDVDTRDWAHTPPETICQNILDTVHAGDIILMHDFIGYDSPTPEALRLVIPALLERGYKFVTVGEMLSGV